MKREEKVGYPINGRFQYPVVRELYFPELGKGGAVGPRAPDSFSNDYYKWKPSENYYKKGD